MPTPFLTDEHCISLFWEKVSLDARSIENYDSFHGGFYHGEDKSTYFNCRQGMLLCEEHFDEANFKLICEQTARKIRIHPDFHKLPQTATNNSNICCILMTSGPHEFWESVLEREGLRGNIHVIGGTRLSDGFVVTQSEMAKLAAGLKNTHNIQTWAFGDESDVHMLSYAYSAVVVVTAFKTESEAKKAVTKHWDNIAL
ncbi:uracil phosphoribosyltransferase-domain-containing protein [Penicillium angulare]|uniref:uracil phosphoribosyltransferase-domain-containing protein n=1 Tax=Penicillium angulare TaxID=116970 RepID=UPI002540B9E6|nr:uracil phosphoribosyltransferase-domain-containing protein [Penicillium angulare]KAJ5261128.1 uracil phosphoribosyltransferase-domain-containing protein [Penicillium angulare]